MKKVGCQWLSNCRFYQKQLQPLPRVKEQKSQNDALKAEPKHTRLVQRENVALKQQIKRDSATIYHLRHPQKWQWCDSNGYA